MENMDKVRAQLAKDTFARLNKIEVTEIKPGFARAMMEVGPEHLNSLYITHGGAVFALVDMAFAAASNSHGIISVALNISINFLKATIQGQRLIATATEDKLTNRTGLYRIVVEDEAGDMVALAEGLVYRKKDRIY